ncbi:MAG: EamA/RhaT family transporter [Candidatus Kapaibacterium sp.]|nr:MAG: EamA/RhaT family transporter [Candidatus Kapabacteria bacterium]
MSQHSRALALLALTAVLWSSGGFLIKLISWNAFCIAGMRGAIAAACIALLMRKHLVFNPTRLSFYERCAALVYTSTVTLFVSATKLTTAANAILLQYTAPVYVAIFGAWFLSERTDKRDWITLAAVLCGMVLFFVEGLSADNMLGNCLALLSGLSFAWLTLFMRKEAQIRHAQTISLQNTSSISSSNSSNSGVNAVFWGNILTACIGAPFVVQSFLGGTAPVSGDAAWQSWLGLVLLGVFQLGISYILYARALPHVSALEAILIPVIEPLLNPVWVAIATGEKPSFYAALGGIVVVAAITVRSLLALRAPRTNP